jgi:hypothetical protein
MDCWERVLPATEITGFVRIDRLQTGPLATTAAIAAVKKSK